MEGAKSCHPPPHGPSFNYIVHFVAVARQGGVNAAARETGIPKATLSLHARSAYEVERAGEQSGLALGKPKGQAINHISRGRPVRSSPFQ
jgi:hypothetical protein